MTLIIAMVGFLAISILAGVRANEQELRARRCEEQHAPVEEVGHE